MRRRKKDAPETFEEEVRRVAEERRVQDLKTIINLVLSSPLKDKGEVTLADGNLSLEALSKSNTDVQTRIIMQLAKGAATGDVKSAEFLMRFSGKEPPKQQQITMELPTIIDDMSCRATPVVASSLACKDEEEDDEDES